MLDVAPTELLLVAVVAVIVIGPKDLPKAMRVVGYWVGKMRGVARQFRNGFDEMVRESEFAEMEKKWAEENARIMREFPSADTPPAPALPPPTPALPAPEATVAEPAATDAAEPGAPASAAIAEADAVSPDPEPVMTVEPTLFDDLPPVAQAEPAPTKPKRARKAAQEAKS